MIISTNQHGADGGDLILGDAQFAFDKGSELVRQRRTGTFLHAVERVKIATSSRTARIARAQSLSEAGELVVDRKVRFVHAAESLNQKRKDACPIGSAPAMEVDRIVLGVSEDPESLGPVLLRLVELLVGSGGGADQRDAQRRVFRMRTFEVATKVEVRTPLGRPSSA